MELLIGEIDLAKRAAQPTSSIFFSFNQQQLDWKEEKSWIGWLLCLALLSAKKRFFICWKRALREKKRHENKSTLIILWIEWLLIVFTFLLFINLISSATINQFEELIGVAGCVALIYESYWLWLGTSPLPHQHSIPLIK